MTGVLVTALMQAWFHSRNQKNSLEAVNKNYLYNRYLTDTCYKRNL